MGHTAPGDQAPRRGTSPHHANRAAAGPAVTPRPAGRPPPNPEKLYVKGGGLARRAVQGPSDPRGPRGVVDCRALALVAQRIEHLTTDQKVGGSSPSERATDVFTFHQRLCSRLALTFWFLAMGADCPDADDLPRGLSAGLAAGRACLCACGGA